MPVTGNIYHATTERNFKYLLIRTKWICSKCSLIFLMFLSTPCRPNKGQTNQTF